MKSGSVLALQPGFFTSARPGSHSRDLSDRDQAARMLVMPESVYGKAWTTARTAVQQVAVVVREPADWLPPGERGAAVRAIEGEGGERDEGDTVSIHHHEAFFNGSLILTSEEDKLREEGHYRRLLDRTTVSWINNCGTSGDLVENFISAVIK